MCDSAEILKKASLISGELLPSKSKYRYEAAFEQFMRWRSAINVETFSENVFLVYFEELSKKYKASTLWSTFSMLKTILNIKENINLGKYMKLQAFLKRKSENYVPKKSAILTEDDFSQFLETAPDETFLLYKAVVAVGLSGACRREELCYLRMEDMTDFNGAMLIKLTNTKTKIPRSFTVSGGLYTILKKYSALRPPSLKTGTLTSVAVGMTCSWSSSAIPVFRKEVGVTISQEAWIGSIVALGAFVGAFPTGPLAHRIGRKRTLQLLMLPLMVSWFLLAYFYHNISIVYLGRFMGGLSMGGVSVAAPLYVAELAHISIRGTLGTFFQVQITVGLLMSYIFGDLLPDLKTLSLVCAVLPVVFLLCSLFIPESPVYLCEISQMDKAQNSLIWFRGRDYDVEDELVQISDHIKEASLNEAKLSDLISVVATRKALIISLGLMAFQQLSGINAVLFYSNSIFEKSGAALSPGRCSILVGAVQVIATLASTALIDKSGRKILLILSSSIMCLSLAAMGFYTHAGLTSYTWVPLASLALFIVAFSIGFGPIPWILMSELFPPAVKSVASSIAAASNWLLAFLVTNQFNGLMEVLGLGPALLIFSLICAVATAFVIILVPETKGRSVEEVRCLLEGEGLCEQETREKITTIV